MRNVRNFFIKGQVDGRETPIGTGPRSKDGGFELEIFMRENGSISDKTVHISGFARPDGTLELRVFHPNGAEVITTER